MSYHCSECGRTLVSRAGDTCGACAMKETRQRVQAEHEETPEREVSHEERCEPVCGATQWTVTEAYCGDEANLVCTITGNPPDGPAIIEILHPENGSVIETINAEMTGGRVESTWVTKAQTENWRTDEIPFRVKAAGLTCNSSNVFTFRDRPTSNWTRKDFMRSCPRREGVAVQRHRTVYELNLEADKVKQRLKLKSFPTGGITDETKTAFETMVTTQSQATWNNGSNDKTFHRRNCQRGDECDCAFDCCKVGYELEINFVDADQHRRVYIVPQPDPPTAQISSWCRWDDSRWAYPPKAVTTYSHEVGHMLGQYDEYVTRCNDPSAAGTLCRQPAPAPAGQHNLMSHSGNSTLLSRHYRRILSFINSKSGNDTYDILPECT